MTSGQRRVDPIRDLNNALYEKGWKQGAVIDCSALDMGSQLVGERDNGGNLALVVVSHDCDILNSTEPYIEVMKCRTGVDKGKIGSYSAGSPRYFVVDFTQGIVACAFDRILLDKRKLDQFPLLASTILAPEMLWRFRSWLARRFDRPAWDDAVQDGLITPIMDLVRIWKKRKFKAYSRLNDQVMQLRIELSEEAPYHATILIVYDDDDSNLTEEDLQGIDLLAEALGLLQVGEEFTVDNVLLRPKTEMYWEEILRTKELSMEWHSFDGEELVGVLPDGQMEVPRSAVE